MMQLSGYRILWLLVLFDLPVTEKIERKAAAKFRNNLCDLGFEMAQFSVYMKWCYGYDSAQSLIGKVRKLVPAYGSVSIITFTDKQYETMVSIRGGKAEIDKKMPDQYELF